MRPIPNTYRKAIQDKVKDTYKDVIKSILKSTEDKDSSEDTLNVISRGIYKPMYELYSFCYYISIKLYCKINKDSKYDKYSELSFKDFKNIQKDIKPDTSLKALVSNIVVFMINILSSLIITSLVKLMKFKSFRSFVETLLAFVLFLYSLIQNKEQFDLGNSNLAEDFIQIKHAVSSICKNILSDKETAISFYSLYIAPYIEESFKIFCSADTQLGLTTIIIANIIEEANKYIFDKYTRSLHTLIEKYNNESPSYATISPYTIKLKSKKDMLIRMLLLLSTSFISRYALTTKRVHLVLLVNIFIHFLYNSYIFSKYIDPSILKVKK